MATLLLAAGDAGERRSLPNARLMIHQPSGGASGQASDIAIHAQEIIETRSRLNTLYSRHTGKSLDIIGEYPLLLQKAHVIFLQYYGNERPDHLPILSFF